MASSNNDSRFETVFRELETRVHRGERRVARQLLNADEALRADDRASTQLIYCEYLLLVELDEVPSRKQWLEQFPEYRERLERVLAIDQLLSAPQMGAEPAEPQAGEQPAGPPEASVSSAEDPHALAETWGFDPAAEAASEGVDFVGSAPSLRPGDRFGDYELQSRLGAGGMGIVYLAWQISMDRPVAVKIIRPERLEELAPQDRQEWLHRFRAEAQSAARLDHEHVVTVYEVGEHHGIAYYSMRYIPGKSLADLVREGPLENRRAAQLVERVARAVHHAHCQSVLHRDIKPRNILVRQLISSVDSSPTRASQRSGASGDAAPVSPDHPADQARDEVPYVTDFGLSKCLDEGTESATRTGEMIGTPSYMSPEQALDASRCTAAADIYGLGATLYDLLAGRPPFRAATAVETLRQVIDQNPVAPRALNPAIDPDLETIALKALAKEPTRRYTTAEQMANDLRRFLAGEPIHARPVGTGERVRRWCRRNPVIAGLAGGIAVLLVLVAGVSVLSSIRLTRAADNEQRARVEAERYFDVAMDAIDGMLMELSDESLAHVPQMEQVRETLQQKTVALHTDLLEFNPTHPALRLQFAGAHHRLGRLYELLGEHDRAKAAFAEAIRICNDLLQREPDDRVRAQLAVSHNMLAEVLRKTDPAEARQHYQRAYSIQSKLLRRYPKEAAHRRELSRTLNNLGILLQDTNQLPLAKEALSTAIEHLETLTRNPDAPPDWFADLARSHINLGVLYKQQEGPGEAAEAAYRGAVGNLRQLVSRHPENREYQYKLAVALLDLGNLLKDRPGHAKDASRVLQEANERLSTLRTSFSMYPLYWYELANSHNSLANVAYTTGDYAGVREQLLTAQETLEQLEEKFPTYEHEVADYQSLRGIIHGGMGAYEFQMRDPPDLKAAKEHVEQAIHFQQQAIEQAPDNPVFRERAEASQTFLEEIEMRMAESEPEPVP